MQFHLKTILILLVPVAVFCAGIANGKQSDWRKFSENEWYEAYEFKLSPSKSAVRWNVTRNDPQLGIGLLCDISKIAESRGYAWIKISELSPSAAKTLANSTDSPWPLEESFEVDFLTKKQEGVEGVFQVESTANLRQDH